MAFSIRATLSRPSSTAVMKLVIVPQVLPWFPNRRVQFSCSWELYSRFACVDVNSSNLNHIKTGTAFVGQCLFLCWSMITASSEGIRPTPLQP